MRVAQQATHSFVFLRLCLLLLPLLQGADLEAGSRDLLAWWNSSCPSSIENASSPSIPSSPVAEGAIDWRLLPPACATLWSECCMSLERLMD